MDVLKLIEAQIENIKKESTSTFLDLIFNHLIRAEIYYSKGKSDDHFYNDVIYRTNQAFEGALKEAFKVLGNKKDEEISRITTNEIEKYLKNANIFKERVLKLFENYRQEWRNKSTHDYKLILDENEAFLALINVSSFVHLLLRQIQEKLSYEIELKKENTEETISETHKIINRKDYKLVDKVLKLLALFIKEQDNLENLPEFEINGKLNAFFEKADERFTIHREFKYDIGNISIRPDFVIEYDNEKIILEIKRKQREGKFKDDMDQLTSYLTVTGLKNGILFFAASKIENGQLQVIENNVSAKEMKYNIYIVV